MSDCVMKDKEIWSGICPILSNEPVGEGTYKIAFAAPELARRARPGQFVMLRLTNSADPILGRPFGIYSADAESGRVEAVYAVVGKGTKRLAGLVAGTELSVWGPLGKGWDSAKRADGYAPKLALVAGGVGCVPFHMLLQELGKDQERQAPVMIYGARSANRLVCVDDYVASGADVRLVTEDGSSGARGLVTGILAELFADADPGEVQVLACGPTPMLRAVAKDCAARGVECWTSLESPMACGLGICFSCVVDWKKDDGTWDYKRTCVDGPVFDAARLKWDK